MATFGLFLPVDDKLLRSYIDSNYDNDTLGAVILTQQDLHIKPLIGSGLYDQIEAQIIAGTLTALNTTLRDLTRKALRFYVLADWQFEASAKNTNKGSQEMNGNNSSAADQEMLIQRVQRYLDKAQVYAQRVSDYLCENSTDYPLYNNPGSGADTIYPNRKNYSTGWVMNIPDEDYNQHLDSPSP